MPLEIRSRFDRDCADHHRDTDHQHLDARKQRSSIEAGILILLCALAVATIVNVALLFTIINRLDSLQ